jgi:MYXO-CTERM domain-containing protein
LVLVLALLVVGGVQRAEISLALALQLALLCSVTVHWRSWQLAVSHWQLAQPSRTQNAGRKKQQQQQAAGCSSGSGSSGSSKRSGFFQLPAGLLALALLTHLATSH